MIDPKEAYQKLVGAHIVQEDYDTFINKINVDEDYRESVWSGIVSQNPYVDVTRDEFFNIFSGEKKNLIMRLWRKLMKTFKKKTQT